MKSTSFEEAQHCPKCGNTGQLLWKRPGPDNSKIHIIACQNKPCLWYGTTWVIQQLSDGTVPVRTATIKTFPTIPEWQRQKARDLIETMNDSNLPMEGQ